MYKETLNRGNAYDLGDINNEGISGAKKVAVLLMTLGNDLSSNILKNLSDKQVQKIGVEIANLHKVTAEERRKILREFLEVRKSKDFSMEGGIDYARALFQGAFDDSKANKLIEGIKYETSTQAFASARKADINQILSCIEGESSQTIAIILSNLQAEKSAQIICKLEENLQKEVALKLGTISNISPIVIKAVDSALEKKLFDIGEDKIEASNGFDSLLDILTKVDGKTEKSIISFLEAKNNMLAERVKANMFVFEDIVKLDDRSVQKILKEVNLKDVAIALKGVNQDISNIILRNQSSRAADALREEVNLLGAVKISQVEEAKRNIVKVIRRLEQEKVISTSNELEEEFVV
ncbi:flagellar motor switch protein FliG [Clostridium sp. D53t1_180928_C8]|uniref:flagellar motor switch protein FliG n=1 Tax=Clostridium sp. D53t1_180928_C8 TaxID=2787101 RepID=UPI0018A8D9F5|nr:flagellar motor switch protein FliG [Clostridium sp. D53t1_180928_C8]